VEGLGVLLPKPRAPKPADRRQPNTSYPPYCSARSHVPSGRAPLPRSPQVSPLAERASATRATSSETPRRRNWRRRPMEAEPRMARGRAMSARSHASCRVSRTRHDRRFRRPGEHRCDRHLERLGREFVRYGALTR
jgi:hypothetical protein